MARPLRIQFAGAIYHAMARGNARQRIFRDTRYYERFLEGVETTVEKFGFEVFSFVCMPNHVHLFFRMPETNRSQGMQYLLSSYANCFNARHRRPGHLFQGRFKGELIEDERYFWNVSRYIHLNPVRGRRPLAVRPERWPWSSYPGYRWQRRRVGWVAYETVYQAWEGAHGGKNAAAAYRRFVDAGVADPPENPLAQAVEGWLLGGQEFVDRIKGQLGAPKYRDEVPAARCLLALSASEVLATTADFYGVDAASFRVKYKGALARDVAAWLARRLTTATLRELAAPFGLGHPDSVRDLARRAERAMARSTKIRKDVAALKKLLQRGPHD